MQQSEAIAILNETYRRCQDVFPSGVQDAYLYGSYARGDFDNESDVDILLTVDVLPTELSAYRNRIAAISSELSLAHDVTVSIAVKPLEISPVFGSVALLQECVAGGYSLCGMNIENLYQRCD